MAFTTNWSWDSVNKNTDVNIDQDTTVRTTRNNWSLTRSRHTNDVITSQLNDSAAAISAYAGGTLVTETIGDLAGLQFDTTQNWTDTSYIYLADESYSWIGSGGVPRYAFELDSAFTNKPNAAKTTIVKPVLTASADSETGVWEWKWQAGEWDVGDDSWQTDFTRQAYFNFADANPPNFTVSAVSADAFKQKYTVVHTGSSGPTTEKVTLIGSVDGVIFEAAGASGTYKGMTYSCSVGPTWVGGSEKGLSIVDFPTDTTPTNRIETGLTSAASFAIEPEDAPNVDGLLFNSASGTFTGSATADAPGSATGAFYCTTDTKSYESFGADWHKQTQTWTFKDEYQ